jgi:hypothetical protein
MESRCRYLDTRLGACSTDSTLSAKRISLGRRNGFQAHLSIQLRKSKVKSIETCANPRNRATRHTVASGTGSSRPNPTNQHHPGFILVQSDIYRHRAFDHVIKLVECMNVKRRTARARLDFGQVDSNMPGLGRMIGEKLNRKLVALESAAINSPDEIRYAGNASRRGRRDDRFKRWRRYLLQYFISPSASALASYGSAPMSALSALPLRLLSINFERRSDNVATGSAPRLNRFTRKNCSPMIQASSLARCLLPCSRKRSSLR